MKKRIVITNIERDKTNTKLYLFVSVNDIIENYQIDVYNQDGIIAFPFHREPQDFTPNKLVQLLMENLRQMKVFNRLLSDFYQGKSIKFPVDLGYF